MIFPGFHPGIGQTKVLFPETRVRKEAYPLRFSPGGTRFSGKKGSYLCFSWSSNYA
jgi:hypothetical protein